MHVCLPEAAQKRTHFALPDETRRRPVASRIILTSPLKQNLAEEAGGRSVDEGRGGGMTHI